MAWIKVPPEHRPIFLAALPRDARIETVPMFGGIMARANGHPFAGLFGRSAMVLLDEPDRREALALEGAGFFDPMGNGRVRSEKVMLPEAMMSEPNELANWLRKAFSFATKRPAKAPKPAKKASARTKLAKPNAKKASARTKLAKPNAKKANARTKSTRP